MDAVPFWVVREEPMFRIGAHSTRELSAPGMRGGSGELFGVNERSGKTFLEENKIGVSYQKATGSESWGR